MQQPTQPHMPPDLKAYTHDDIPAQETGLDCATADVFRPVAAVETPSRKR
jgi:hypothetical protein